MAGLPESLCANFTVEWPFPSMNPKMDLELAGIAEAFLTNFTFELACVNAEMNLESPSVLEALFANYTLEWALACVNLEMTLEVALLLETL